MHDGLLEAGIDEAGRGCLMGPVFAAAVILPPNCNHPNLQDSKRLNAHTRQQMRLFIETNAIAWQVAWSDVSVIQEKNILGATFLAMHEAIRQLHPKPQLLLVDGNRFPAYIGIPHACIVRGDGIYASIAAASILAKTHRDEWVMSADEQYPNYGWRQNKGYGAPAHIQALRQHGLTPYHRPQFVTTALREKAGS